MGKLKKHPCEKKSTPAVTQSQMPMVWKQISPSLPYGPADLFSYSTCDNTNETWTALLGRGPGVDRARSALLVARGMPGERGGVPSAL